MRDRLVKPTVPTCKKSPDTTVRILMLLLQNQCFYFCQYSVAFILSEMKQRQIDPPTVYPCPQLSLNPLSYTLHTTHYNNPSRHRKGSQQIPTILYHRNRKSSSQSHPVNPSLSHPSPHHHHPSSISRKGYHKIRSNYHRPPPPIGPY